MNSKELKASVGALNPCVSSKETTSVLAEVARACKHCACYTFSSKDEACDVVWMSRKWIPKRYLESTGTYSVDNLKFMPVSFGIKVMESFLKETPKSTWGNSEDGMFRYTWGDEICWDANHICIKYNHADYE